MFIKIKWLLDYLITVTLLESESNKHDIYLKWLKSLLNPFDLQALAYDLWPNKLLFILRGMEGQFKRRHF